MVNYLCIQQEWKVPTMVIPTSICLPYVLNHAFQLDVITLLILTFGFRDHLQEQIAAIEADLHSTTTNMCQDCIAD